MVITDDHAAAARAMLALDSDEYERVTARLDQGNAWDGFNVLLAAAFYEAVRRRFGDGYTLADIIHLVAGVRVRLQEDGEGDELDPKVAEQLVLAVLGNGSAEGLDEEAKAVAQITLLTTLVLDEDLDDAGLDEFLKEARKIADSTASRMQ